jgi:hypothetical protein
MTRLLLVPAFLIIFSGAIAAQQGTADPDYNTIGYPGKTWTGAVTAFDNAQRTLTLTSEDKKSTFVASIPDAPYERRRDARNYRVIDFPYDKSAKYQEFQYMGPGNAGTLLPSSDSGLGKQRRNNPSGSDVIGNLDDFMGRRITVYYTTREREVNGKKEKYNDVWRIRIL